MADVAALVEMFEISESSTAEARRLSERDRDYRDNKQWTSDEEVTLTVRKQPIVTYNRVQRKVNFLSGLEKQSRKDPKAFPVEPGDEDAANAATDALRFVCQAERWDKKRSDAWKNLLVEGTAAIMVEVAATKMGYDPAIRHIPWDRFFFDPKSSDLHFSDARYMGVVTWYDMADAEMRWPEGGDALASSLASVPAQDTYEDKPRHNTWAESMTKRVRVCEIYYREQGKWLRCVFTKGGHLEGPEPSPFLDEEGQPENPIKAASLYIDRDNNRYGEVRVLISPQDMINKTNSKWMHFNNMRQIRLSPGAGMEATKARKEAAKPDGVFVADKDDFEVLPTGDLAAAQFNMLQVAMREIDLLGANAALQGKNENDMSGRAILAQQQGGMVEVADPFDVLRELTLQVYRAVWNRIRQVWTDERWVRVTDDERNLRFVGLNQKVTVKMLAEEALQGDEKAIAKFAELVGVPVVQAFMQGDERAKMALGLFVQQNGEAVVETRNAVNELDVDIVIDEGMDTPTVQAEQFDALLKMLPGIFPQGAPPEAMEMLVQASQLRDKDKLLDIIEKMKAGPTPEQQKMQELQMRGAEAEVAKTESETVKNIAQAEAADPRADMQTQAMKAAHTASLAEQKQEHGMALAERKQGFAEQLAARVAEQRARDQRAAA